MANALSIKEYSSKVDAFLRDLPEAMLIINQKLALTTIPTIRKRLIDQGLTAEGKSLGTYSTRPMSPLFFLGHGLKGADKKIEAQLKRQKKAGQRPGVSYKEVREFNNLPTTHVTLSFTGETLGDLAVLNNVNEGSKVITTVGSKDSKTKDIYNKKGKKTGTITTGEVLENLDSKYGQALDTELLDLSKNEQENLEELFNKLFQTFLDKEL